MTSEKARLDREFTECLLLAPKAATPIPMEISLDKDKVKIRTDLKPNTLTITTPHQWSLESGQRNSKSSFEGLSYQRATKSSVCHVANLDI